MNESCHTHELVMSHSHEWVMSHRRHFSMCDDECDMTHSCVWHDSFIRVIWLIHVCDMTHSCVWHDSSVGVAWLTICDMTHQSADALWIGALFPSTSWSVTHDARATWLLRTCDMTPSYVRYDSFVRATEPMHISSIVAERCGAESRWFICVVRFIHTCDMTHSYVRQDQCVSVVLLSRDLEICLSEMWGFCTVPGRISRRCGAPIYIWLI